MQCREEQISRNIIVLLHHMDFVYIDKFDTLTPLARHYNET